MNWNTMYDPLISVQASFVDEKVLAGVKGRCRFCGTDNPKLFRQVAHLIPEALGNKRIFSLDECDTCNEKFSAYESALVTAVGPLLTLGGTRGKNGKVRQTGRTDGDTVLMHDRVDGQRKISVVARNVQDLHDRLTQDGGELVLRTPLPSTPYTPLHAYKALAKMAIALMPPEVLVHFPGLVSSLQDRNAPPPGMHAAVGLSFGSIGNAPPGVAAFLFRRKESEHFIPYLVFLLCAGSVCLQFYVPSDDMDHYGPDDFVIPSIQFSFAFGTPLSVKHRIQYSEPHPLDWSSPASTAQPLVEIFVRVDPQTNSASIEPVWR